ncbi:hypothetical protein [Cellulomonas sp. RIT-PI-Y]|uniref:hypothetical protein n=1 Tax=Cellulomonas sp. RIT-PI-Y TaxID=3035297 RepID=UPI0021DA211C|nr:hypothetical protein [Cellulomonas sp. RIT-PI-Y]
MRQRFNPATRRRRAWLTLAIAVVAIGSCGLGLFAACTGTATIADLESDKANLMEVARDVMPDIAESLDGTITEAWGEWRYGGAKTIDRRSYGIRIMMTLDSPSESDYAEALTGAGFTITQEPDPDSAQTLVGKIGDADILVNVEDSEKKTFSLVSPWREMQLHTPTSRPYGREPIDLF